ncbi:hypothetical protein M0813_30214 [Anaeramoeba flamelloides]|uniref:Rap-GAP domain-containing protein n=1 Tax=Anaeramoeba flamelloides TaxID=1746091 RepID=A0ABQ8XKD8_9EUKA|nr:hypothetical protein M0813_30214 [Anaeramoeba flamelloides]
MSVLIPKQAQKHLIKFKNENKKVISRLKSFDTYLNLCNFAEREEKRFLMSHSQEIYRLLQDSFFGFSSKNKSLKTNRSLPKIGDYPLLFRLLAKLVHSFDLMIFLCSIKHRQIVRSQAFPLFLFFIDDLAPLCDERIYPALESIVCFDTFTEEFKDSTIQFRVFPNQMPIRDIPLKEKTPKTNTERLEILQKFLDFILNKTEKKDFWFRTFKKHFLTTLYPSVEKRLNINKTNENNGFQKYCPYEINLKIVKFFISILKNRKFPINIYQNKEYLEYLFEIFKQTLFMPSKYEGIIIQVLSILNKWYSDQKSYFDIQNNMNFFIHSFLNHIILALINPKEDINNKLFETKFNIICDILKTLAIQKESYLGKETWEILLVSVIKITKFYFLNDYFTNVKKIPTSFQKRIINILFHIFIYSKTTKRYHWLLLKKLINQICNNNIVIVQWKRSLSELTLQIHHYIFSLDECVIKNSEYKQLINLEDHEVKLIHRNIKRFSSTKELMENEICEREQVLEKMYQQKYLNNNQDSINQMIKLENNRRIDKIKNWKENQKDQLINFFMFNKKLIRFELHKILLNILKSQEFSILINNQQTKTIIKNDFLKIGQQNQSNGQQQTESKEQSNQNSGKKVRQWQRRRHQGIFVRKIPIKLLSTSIWSMNLLCIVELLSDNPSLEIISSSIGGIIKQMESNVDEIVIFSRFCLANIFQYYSIIKKKSETLTLDVITQLLTIIYKILKLINPISLTINEKLKKIPINVKEIFKLVITIMRKDSSILFNEKIRNIFFLTFFKIHEYENILNDPKLIQDFKERGLWEINKKSNENIASQGLQVKKTKTARTKSFSGNDLAKNNRRKNKRRTLTKKKLDFNYQKCESKFSNDNEQLNPITFPKWFYQKNDLIKSNLLIQVFNDGGGGGEEGERDEGEDDDKNKKSQNIPKIQVFIPKKKETVIPIGNITINNFRNVDFFLLNYFRLISNYNLLKSNYELIDSYLDKFDNLPELLINNFKKKTKNNVVDNDDNNSNGLLLLNKKINENNYFHLISFNDSIISLNEISNNFKNRKIRLILRDTTGKFVWDAKYLNNPLQKNDDDDDDDDDDENEILNKKKNYSINSLNFDRFIDDNSKLKKKNEQNEKIIIINRKKGDLLNFKNVKNIKKINMLNEMLKYAEEINDPILLESEDKRHKIFENNDLKQLNKIVPNVKKLKIRNINSSMPIKGLSVFQEKKNNKSNVFEGFEIIDKVQDKVNDKDNNAINEKEKEEDQEEFKSLGVQWNETRTKIYNQRKQFSILFNNGLENFKSQKKCNNEKDNVGINMINKESNYNKNISMEKNEHKNKNEIENENKNKNEDIFTINESIKAEMPPPPKPLHFLHYSRLFLSHLGFSSINNFSSINYLKQNEDIKSKISQLDEIPNRKIMKIEVFYIDQLQNYQKIEKNKTRYSKKFLNFFTSLGWKIDISKHYGYLSRILKNKIKIDSITRYYSNLEVEVLFNINFGNNVKEENNENENKNKNEKVVERGEENNSKSCKGDENQEERGKSLECCQYVQIYWLEDENSYDGGLSSSSDYPITIVIFPMKNGMYRFQIVSKKKSIDSVPVFAGPILTSANLVQSIRMISIYYNYYLFDKENTNKYPTNPHYSRFDQILKIIQNGRDNLKFDQFSKRVFIGNDTEKDDFLLFKQFLNN